MLKDFRLKEVNFNLEQRGVAPIKVLDELEFSMAQTVGAKYTPIKNRSTSLSRAKTKLQFILDGI
tara:strand:- start:1201 stop:1395 length:195 start_codon:yes stop_codon:yes gene_type:complete